MQPDFRFTGWLMVIIGIAGLLLLFGDPNLS